MKLRKPDFSKHSLSVFLLYLQLPVSPELLDLVKKLGKEKPKGVQCSRNEGKFRIRIKITDGKNDNIEILGSILDTAIKKGSDPIGVLSDCTFVYDPESYETDPKLPIELPEDANHIKGMILTGVKLNFTATSSSLKFTIIDLQYCANCDKFHGISNRVVFKEDIRANINLLLNLVKKGQKFSEAFVKMKKKENA